MKIFQLKKCRDGNQYYENKSVRNVSETYDLMVAYLIDSRLATVTDVWIMRLRRRDFRIGTLSIKTSVFVRKRE